MQSFSKEPGGGVSDSEKDSPKPESGCSGTEGRLPWVDREDWYATYKSLSKLLCCEIWTMRFGRLEVSRVDERFFALLAVSLLSCGLLLILV